MHDSAAKRDGARAACVECEALLEHGGRRGLPRLRVDLEVEGVAVADAEDVRRIAASLPGVEEIPSDGFDFRVVGRGFIWSYPESVPGRRRRIRSDIAVLFVGDEAEKQALLLGEPDVFFTVRGYGDAPLILLRLETIDAMRLEELIGDAWEMRRSNGPLPRTGPGVAAAES